MGKQGVPFQLQLTPGQPQHTPLHCHQVTPMLEKHVCFSGTGSPSRTRTSPIPQGNTTFISEQLMLEPTPVCTLILQKNPKRCSGLPKETKDLWLHDLPSSYQSCISKSNQMWWQDLVPHDLWELVDTWDTSAAFTEEKATAGIKQLGPYRRVPPPRESSHLISVSLEHCRSYQWRRRWNCGKLTSSQVWQSIPQRCRQLASWKRRKLFLGFDPKRRRPFQPYDPASCCIPQQWCQEMVEKHNKWERQWSGRRRIWCCLIVNICYQPHLPVEGSWKQQLSEQALVPQNREVLSHPGLQMHKVLYPACEPLPGSVLTWHFHQCTPVNHLLPWEGQEAHLSQNLLCSWDLPGQNRHSWNRATSAVVSPLWFACIRKERYPSLTPDPTWSLSGSRHPSRFSTVLFLMVSLPATLCFPYWESKSSFSCLPKPLLMFIPNFFPKFWRQAILSTRAFVLGKKYLPLQFCQHSKHSRLSWKYLYYLKDQLDRNNVI